MSTSIGNFEAQGVETDDTFPSETEGPPQRRGPGTPAPLKEGPSFKPGDLTPWWYSPEPPAKLTPEQEKALLHLANVIGSKDVAARRWEVQQSWEARLFDRGYHYLLPRRGGGWILAPFITNYNRTSSGDKQGVKYYGYETNIYTTYGEIITAALTRDVPRVRFEPCDPFSDADTTAAEAATRYARIFSRQNDLLDLLHQIAYYLRNDGRCLVVTDHVVDGQRFGWESPAPVRPVVPETEESQEQEPQIYIVRHGETTDNAQGVMRGRRPTPLDASGRTDSDQAADFLKDKQVTRVVSSPVPRAFESAQRIASILGVPVDVDDRLGSLDVGDLAGEKSSDHGDELHDAFESPEEPIGATGESPAAFDGRISDAMMELLSSGERIAVVTHDSVITAIARLAQDSPIRADLVPPGGIAGFFILEGERYAVRQVYPTVQPPGETLGDRGPARGAEVVEAFGKLEHKLPMNTMSLSDCVYAQVSREYDISYVKAMVAQICPDKVNKIKPGGVGPAENELDRIARINVALALEAAYVTGDSMVRDCTIQRIWLRPAFFYEEFQGGEQEHIRDELLELFPAGCLMMIAGEELIMARRETMDDHLSLIHAFPGSGQNRISLLDKVLSLQKRLNNWVDLLGDFFVRTIPQRYVDADVLDVEALNLQTPVPGAYIPLEHDKIQAAGGMAGTIFVEPTPTHQPSMPEFIKLFVNEIPQLLSGGLPSVFGAAANTDTVGGIMIQRDQALGRLGTPWHAIQMATANYFRQAVQLAARCRRQPISSRIGSSEVVRVEIAELKGNILAYPESNANFPESWVQKQSRYQMLLQDVGNPIVARILASPANFKLARDMVGIEEFEIVEADAYEKQLGELDVLLHTAPVPNPKKMQLQVQVQEAMAAHQATMVADPQQQSALAEAAQQAAAMPDFVSSVEVDPYTDDHLVEAQACRDWINKPEGRKYRYGTAEQRKAFQNVRLHFLEHKHFADALKAESQASKPPSTSISFRDLPPDSAAAVLHKQGLPGEAADVQQSRIAQSAIKRLAKPSKS